jgi:hypothetical protein
MDNTPIINKLLEHDEKLSSIQDRMVTREDFHQLLQTEDQMMVILKRLDEERVFTTAWVKRIEHMVEEQEKELTQQKEEIKQIKLQLKIT